MNKRFSFLAPLVVALALCLSGLAHAKETAAQIAARKTIAATYARNDRALRGRDINTYMASLADDYQFYSIARFVQDRAQRERVQRFSFASPTVNVLRYETTLDKVEWRGPDAVVWTTAFFKMAGATTTQLHVKSREYWGKTARGWQLRQTVEISAKGFMAGQPIEM